MDLPGSTDWFTLDAIAGASGITVNGSSTGQNLIQGAVGPVFLDNAAASGHGNFVLETLVLNNVGNDVLTGGADTAAGGIADNLAGNFPANAGDNFFPEGGNDTINIESHVSATSVLSPATDSTVFFGQIDVGNNGGSNFGANGTAGGADWGIGVVWGEAVTDIVGGAEVYVDGFGHAGGVTTAFSETINGFVFGPKGDTVVIYTPDWATGALTTGGIDLGIVRENGAAPIQGTGAASLNNIGFAGEITALTANPTANVTMNSIGQYANASQLQTALTTNNVGNIVFGGLGAHDVEHLLIAYGTGTGTNIADVTITNISGHILFGLVTRRTRPM